MELFALMFLKAKHGGIFCREIEAVLLEIEAGLQQARECRVRQALSTPPDRVRIYSHRFAVLVSSAYPSGDVLINPVIAILCGRE
jgi:hypothetical protein